MTPLDASISRPLEGGPSFPLRDRLFRAVWALAWLVLARWTPPPLHRWRRLVLLAFGARAAPGARVHANVRIWHPAHLDLGAHSLIGPGVRLYNQGRITIGARSTVSQGAHLCASSHDIGDRNFQLQLRPIIIGAGCWVAADAFVGPGVVMADGAVLGACGALFGDAVSNGVYRGNPAELIKQRPPANRA